MIPLITVQVRGLDTRLWDIINKDGPLTAEEQAYIDAVEASYQDEEEEATDVDL